jgi:hypothetical protein
MIRVVVEVREEATSSRAAVSADSVCQAVSIMEGRHPGRDVRVVFPIDAEEFFLESAKKTEGNRVKGDDRTGLVPDRVR